MKEKITTSDMKKMRYLSGYFKPKGKDEKRGIHKKLRKMFGVYRLGIMNSIGVNWEWS
jgi:hypothetical protein